MKIELSPLKRLIIFIAISIFNITLIHINVDFIVNYLTVGLSPIMKISLFIIGLIVYGLLAAYAKIREAGFSGQYNERQKFFWTTLTIDISITGVFKLVSLILQILIFSSLLYLVGGYYISVIYDLMTGNFDMRQHIPGFIYIPLFALLIICIAYVIKIFEKIKSPNKEKRF